MESAPPPFENKSEDKFAISINGKLTKKEDARISIFDRGFLYGDSVYEVCRTYNGVPFLLEEHLARLWHSALKLDFIFDFTPEFLTRQINNVLGELGEESAYIRIIITRGEGPLGIIPPKDIKHNIIILAKHWPPNPTHWYEKGVSVIISKVERVAPLAIDPNVKSGNYLNSVMAIHNAKKEGAFDAVMLNREGFITEGSTNNIWIVKNNVLYTPPLLAGILEGITRKTLILLAKKNNLNVIQENFTPNDLINADEAFLTATTKELVPIVQVDSTPIGLGTPGPMYKKLHQIYKSFVKEKTNI